MLTIRKIFTAFTVLILLTVSLSAAEQNAQNTAEKIVDMPRMRVYKNIPYVTGGGERQQLDLYLPKTNGAIPTATSPVPVIVWVHWGSWCRGSKDPCIPVGLGYVAKGYAMVSINYRYTSTAPFPAQLVDCKSAIRWLRAHADDYGLDADHIGAWGVSAGAHLAALLGTTADSREFDLGEHLEQSSAVACVCDLFGPADVRSILDDPNLEVFREKERDSIRLFLGGDPQEKLAIAFTASPTTHVSQGDAPFLIVHGDQDPVVPVRQSERLFEELQRVGVESELIIVPGGSHGPGGFLTPEMLVRYDRFFEKHLPAKQAKQVTK